MPDRVYGRPYEALHGVELSEAELWTAEYVARELVAWFEHQCGRNSVLGLQFPRLAGSGVRCTWTLYIRRRQVLLCIFKLWM